MKILEWVRIRVGKIFRSEEEIASDSSLFRSVETESGSSDDQEQPEYTFVNVNDLPDDLEDKRVYIIGEDIYKWQAAFKCPCGCDALIQLNLLAEARPYWNVSIKKNLISIAPSIERVSGCRSHFTLKRGHINWWPNYSSE